MYGVGLLILMAFIWLEVGIIDLHKKMMFFLILCGVGFGVRNYPLISSFSYGKLVIHPSLHMLCLNILGLSCIETHPICNDGEESIVHYLFKCCHAAKVCGLSLMLIYPSFQQILYIYQSGLWIGLRSMAPFFLSVSG